MTAFGWLIREAFAAVAQLASVRAFDAWLDGPHDGQVLGDAEDVFPARDEAALHLLRTNPDEFFRKTRRREAWDQETGEGLADAAESGDDGRCGGCGCLFKHAADCPGEATEYDDDPMVSDSFLRYNEAPRQPRVVQVLGEAERDAVWQLCNEEQEPNPSPTVVYAWLDGRWQFWAGDGIEWLDSCGGQMLAGTGKKWVEVLDHPDTPTAPVVADRDRDGGEPDSIAAMPASAGGGGQDDDDVTYQKSEHCSCGERISVEGSPEQTVLMACRNFRLYHSYCQPT